MASDTRAPKDSTGRVREKVAVKPGFHLIDWMRVMQASTNFNSRNGGPPRPISKEELAQHKSEFDCWTAFQGKVYNVTQYLPYHPGGSKILLKSGGRDCTKEFLKYHAWVNIDNMLAKCYIGPLIDNTAAINEDEEEEEEGESDEEKKEAK